MRKFVAVSIAAAMMASAGAAFADDALLKKGNCLSCHATDKKLVGPSYKDVAKKYAGDAGAADKLAKKIKAGGAGVWGPIPMPPATMLSDAEAATLAKYVLSLK
ncbi:MAG: c-type cytochrome [Burkholderiaceae bacterium]|nr:c-type cytochrome [Burkholderiaceae bacterium]